ncbi:MAG: haloacid dehalogenase-like hydrolase [Elusimicrobia bacterium]|nr:haloacid dehalogenase-like hydrolase [Elusimicrobiota bacterium]
MPRSRKALCLLIAGLLVAAAAVESAHAYRKRKNPRRKKAAAAAAVQPAGPVVPAGPPPLLAPGRWDPGVRSRIEEFIRSQGKDAPEYDPNTPPVAVFALNDVLIVNDLGEAVFQRMALSSQTAVAAFDFRLDEDFWPILPAAFGRHRLRADYQQLLAVPVSVWPSQPAYRRMRKGFVRMYRDFCSQRGRKECRGLLARMFKGYSEDEAVSYAKDVILDELNRPLGLEFLEDRGSDPAPERIRTGLRPVPEMKDLLAVLGKEGFDVFVVSEDSQIALRQLVKHFGLPPERGLGIKVAMSSSTFFLSDEVEPPFPFRSGKLEAVLSAGGRPPAVVVARGADDAALLSYGEGLRLLIDDGDQSLRRVGMDRGWLIQPAFGP